MKAAEFSTVAATGRVLVLARSVPPVERTFGRLGDLAGLGDALQAAKAGNLKRVDEIEVWWLNTWGPRPSVEELFDEPALGREVMATGILRNAGPRGESLIEWAMVDPCPRCWRRISARAKCRKCSGRGHTNDEWEIVYTDLDGNLLVTA